jgi:hypothetical protein
MKTFTITEHDIGQLADAAASALRRFSAQYSQLRKGFPAVTDADIEKMFERLKADPQLGSRKAPVDTAVFYFTIFMRSVYMLKAVIQGIISHDDAGEGIQLMFSLSLACADALNAIELLSHGGLATELHLDGHAQKMAASIVATRNAEKRHAKTNEVKVWIQNKWNQHRDDYDNNKSKFARVYVKLALQQFGVTVTDKIIRERWLK